MFTKLTLGLIAATALATPLLAQTVENTGRTPQQEYQLGYAATPMPDQAAADAKSRPAVAALNAAEDAQAQSQQQAQNTTAAVADANRALYDADRAAYMAALIRHDAAVDRTDVRWARQQNAYADAMSAWRAQVAACKSGHQRACDMPAPNPADYY